MSPIKSALAVLLAASLLQAQQTLTNEGIISLVKAGVGDDVISAMINAQPGKYTTSPDAIIALKHAGVGDKIVAAMVASASGTRPSGTPLETPTQVALNLVDGTPVVLRTRNNLSSADATSGAHIELEVLDDVKVDGLTVIARGTRATGTITQAEHKKSMARGGKLGITIDSVPLVTDDRVALRGTKEATAGGHTGAMTAGIVTGALIFWPAAPFFLFIHGKEAVVPAGTEITAYTQGHIKLERSKLLAKVAMR